MAMPIKPENRKRYVPWWPQLAHHIKFERAGGRCEWCGAEHGKPHPVSGSRTIMTTAHRDRMPENCHPLNLVGICMRCHLAYDAAQRQAIRARLKAEAQPMTEVG
jgi:hypothetical protein